MFVHGSVLCTWTYRIVGNFGVVLICQFGRFQEIYQRIQHTLRAELRVCGHTAQDMQTERSGEVWVQRVHDTHNKVLVHG